MIGEIREAMAECANRMRRSLQLVGSMNGERNAPIPERNVTLHLASHFIQRGFAVYAEPAFTNTGNSRRIDLVCSNGDATLCVEVKAFGKLAYSDVHRDVERLLKWRPVTAPRSDRIDKDTFWSGKPLWGVVIVESFRGHDVKKLWCAQIDASMHFDKAVQVFANGRRASQNYKQRLQDEMKQLARSLSNAVVGSVRVTPSLWPKSEDLDLLWAAFPIFPNGG